MEKERARMISHIDHIVLTVRDIDKSVTFFTTTFGMTPITYANGRKAVTFGTQKINFQLVGDEVRNHALEGSGDVCLIASVSVEQMQSHLASLEVEVLEGPVSKNGAQGEMQSIYINDLDNNLIEIGFYPSANNSSATEKSQKTSKTNTSKKTTKPRSKKTNTKNNKA